jgi:glycosyltransferase involved in cell wall biosynthesis
VRWVDWVGRLTLWSVTGTLAFASLAAATSALWLLSPLAGRGWFLAVHRAALLGALAAGLTAFLVLFVVHRLLVPPRSTVWRPLAACVHVGLTAFNDAVCIGEAVREFKACPLVTKVIVVDNNSTDGTAEAARAAGADEVVVEPVPGYGSCCLRALAEASRGADVVVLCEGDLTFRGQDVKKLLAYLEDCDLVLGTRTTQELREADTQLDWLINPANQIVAKLIQARFWGTRLTDVGCTYRALRAEAYARLKDRLWVRGNSFSPHLSIEALKLRLRVIEVPVGFRKRGGLSKGVGSNKLKAAAVALRMLGLIYSA